MQPLRPSNSKSVGIAVIQAAGRTDAAGNLEHTSTLNWRQRGSPVREHDAVFRLGLADRQRRLSA